MKQLPGYRAPHRRLPRITGRHQTADQTADSTTDQTIDRTADRTTDERSTGAGRPIADERATDDR
ncbi:hypothetical protein ACIPPJ_16025 [Streptomyces sp. NPDC086091]|uniref:hypothetical protein n=1 Tax=Streptomyces sp. NPDC086091 TaxID=3365751 RepID=UPI0038085FF1